MLVSVVIPTYNRGHRLLPTLQRLLASDITGVRAVEILVVDNGSATAVAPLLNGMPVEAPFSLTCIRLPKNLGPSGARNAGFRESHGDLVLFVDDDILVLPDVVRGHVEAHTRFPGSVIFGRCELPPPTTRNPLYDYLESLKVNTSDHSWADFEPQSVVSSGQLSVERSLFAGQGWVYRDDLQTPAAEEFELSYRLHQRCVPILMGSKLVAWHEQELTIANVCRQQYMHGLGCAAAAADSPETLRLPQLAQIIETVRAEETMGLWTRPKAVLRAAIARPAVRRVLVELCILSERWPTLRSALPVLYRIAVSAHFVAGVWDGLDRSGRQASVVVDPPTPGRDAPGSPS
jgi:hypothetical protein